MPAAEQRLRLPARYRVVRHIANGGMAAVWLAEDELLGRPVAVKLLSPAFAADEVAARRFEREARAAARLSDHPHVVTIYDFGRHEGHLFIVMEHFEGGSVAERLRAGGPGTDGSTSGIAPHLALRWLREAASALDAAHAAGVVHRDVKPHNLLLDGEERLAVADFGIATLASETSLTQTGLVLGTAAYLSPEQRAGRAATPASDRYSLAVVAGELLPGAPETALVRGLADDPTQRPPSARALVDELERAVAPTAATRVLPGAETAVPMARSTRNAGVAAPPRVARRAATPPSTADRTRRPALLFLVALSSLLLAGALAIGLAGRGGDDERAAAPPPTTRDTTADKPAGRSESKGQPQREPTPTPRQLNDLGFAKLPGDAAAAIPLLRRSVDGFRAQGATNDINYAFALFNLGNALRLAGDPGAAIPYLEERLRISDFKRGVVERELDLARAQAGIAEPPGNGKGKNRDKGKRDDD